MSSGEAVAAHDWWRWDGPAATLTHDGWRFLARNLGRPADPRRPFSGPGTGRRPALPPGLPSRMPAGVASRLAAALEDGELSTDPLVRLQHAGGQSYVDCIRRRAGTACPPDAVAFPRSAKSIAAVLEECSRSDIAVVPFGGGTSVVGGVDALAGDHRAVLTVDVSRMDRVLEVDAAGLLLRCEPGLRAPVAEARLAADGLTLGHFPQSYRRATVGGYLATRSAGQASTGYGRFDDLVAGLRLTTPSGELVLPALPGSAAGPDLRRLVIGSEGTLGIVTELTVRLHPAPERRHYEGWLFPSFGSGLEALRRLARQAAVPDVVRLSDDEETRVSLALSGTPRLAAAALSGYLRLRAGARPCLAILGFEGGLRDVRHRRRAAAAVLADAGGRRLGSRPGVAWERHRYQGPQLRDSLLDAGVLVETLETAALWRDLPAVHRAVTSALRRELPPPCIVGCHASHLYPTGTSLYFTVLAAPEPGAEVTRWEVAKRAATEAILAAGGALTHHHAVGTAHAPWLAREDGALGLAALRAVKERLDPAGIMNPGKLFG
jgi:alkyldihydroxyacetonephosphate synthase